MSIGKRVRQARNKAGLNQPELANLIGVKQPTISDLETGKSFSSAYLVQIAKQCNVNPEWLATGNGSVEQDYDELTAIQETHKLVPIKGFARMGQDGYYEEITEGSEGFVELPVSSPYSFALIARGDSMYPVIKDGQVIWCDATMPYHKQDNVAIYKENGAKMIKEFISNQNGVLEVKSVNGGEILKIPLTEVRQIYAVRGVFSPSTIKYIE